MKRFLPLSLIPLLIACAPSGRNTALAPTPKPVATSLATATPIPPSTLPASPAPSAAALPAFPSPGDYVWAPVAEGLNQPVDIQHAGDGSGRLYIVLREGLIRVLQEGTLQAQPFLDIRERVGRRGAEQGLLGLAFHPRFAETGTFFVNYTDRRGNTVIARFRLSEDPTLADPASEEQLLYIEQPYANHNGGGLAFGPDGYLYIGLGDGGSAGDPHGNAQSTDTLLGKMLRLDVDHGQPYAVPADNPFIQGGGRKEIWAYGLRNPWRFSFDALTGDLYIADVGQDAWEEIDLLPAGSTGGANFGWNYFEGTHPFAGTPPADLALVAPIAEYDHTQGCSITGGLVYRGTALPEWQGVYFFGDFCTGAIWGLRHIAGEWEMPRLFETDFSISTFGSDESGEIYLADYRSGTIYRLERRPSP